MNTEIENLKKDSYYGHCYVCGEKSNFIRAHRSLREGYKCDHCQSSLRYRGQAEALLEFYGSSNTFSLKELVAEESFLRLKVFEPGVSGPFRIYLDKMEGYSNSFFWSDVTLGQYRDRVQCQSLEELTFDDESFDLIISSDILEHVRNPWKAFKEIKRILNPGGLHVFSIPIQIPMRRTTVARVDTSGDKDIMLLEPRYHGDGAGGKSLVYVDYGIDIIERLGGMGYIISIHVPSDKSQEARRLITFITKKKRSK